ncbi:MAG: hypothetical protein P8R42_22005 [Candidatus Binatia bacterium]|nr:hypothetical protein [Candidatus Binatia bacterium]
MDAKIRTMMESDVEMTQERFCVAMAARLPSLEDDTLERYFAALSKLVGKLEDEDKTLGQVLNETMTEVASLVMQEMQKGG